MLKIEGLGLVIEIHKGYSHFQVDRTRFSVIFRKSRTQMSYASGCLTRTNITPMKQKIVYKL